MIKKTLSTILASTFMLSSVALASGKKPQVEEKLPKISIEENRTYKKELKEEKNHIYTAQKAFLIGLACAFDVHVEIQFIADKPGKTYNFKISCIHNSKFEYADWPISKQSRQILMILRGIRKIPYIEAKLPKNKCVIETLEINNHVMMHDFIYEFGDLILKIIYRKKINAIKEGKLDEPLNLKTDEEFKNEIKDLFSEILKPAPSITPKVHNFYLPPL